MRVIKSVSFSMLDVYEIGLFNHAEKNGNFSRYVKRLIARDMENILPIIKREPEVENSAKKSFL